MPAKCLKRSNGEMATKSASPHAILKIAIVTMLTICRRQPTPTPGGSRGRGKYLKDEGKQTAMAVPSTSPIFSLIHRDKRGLQFKREIPIVYRLLQFELSTEILKFAIYIILIIHILFKNRVA